MAIRRPRIRPQWRGGLRLGKERDTMTEYIAMHPGYLEDLLALDAQLIAWGCEPMSMEGVKQPFDYPLRHR
jgi:hypothetical protein